MNAYLNRLEFLLCILSSSVELITKLLGFNHSISSSRSAAQKIVTAEQSDSETTQDITDSVIYTDKVVVNTLSKVIQ